MIYYVSQSGAGDGLGGDADNPMSVVSHNADTYTGGDTIIILGVITSQIIIPDSGSTDNPIVYTSDGTASIEGNFAGAMNMNGLDPDAPGITYLVDFYEINVIKPGVTGQTTDIRNSKQGQKYKIILEHHFDTGREAMQLEQEWLLNTKHLQLNTGLLKSGNTETFRYKEYRE